MEQVHVTPTSFGRFSSTKVTGNSFRTKSSSMLTRFLKKKKKKAFAKNGSRSPLFVVLKMARLIVRFTNGSQEKQSACTASILNRRWLLTAAHCLSEERGFNVSLNHSHTFVAQSSATITTENSHIKPYLINRYLIHKDYNHQNAAQGNDLALIYLDRPINDTKFTRMRLSRSAASDPGPGRILRVAGYGLTDHPSETNPSGVRASYLMGTFLPLEKFDQCVTKAPGLSQFVNGSKQVCTTPSKLSLDGLSDICTGDSGGPLFTFKGFQIGITSFSTTRLCAEPDSVSFYTRVSFFYEAITEGMKNNYTAWNVFTK